MDIHLRQGEVASVRVASAPCRLDCSTGRLWVTLDGDNRDYLIQAGTGHIFTAGGSLVVEAWEEATLTIRTTARSASQAELPRLEVSAAVQ